MAYFPIFFNLDDKRILVVGGGKIATEKLEKLVQFSKEITVIAKEVSKEAYDLIKSNCLTLYQRAYKLGDIEGFDIVIVATDDISMQERIFNESRNKGILVNSVDNIKYCDFIFPSFIKKDKLVVAISTGGVSPAFAKHFKRRVQESIPNNVEDFLDKLKEIRETMPKGKERMEFLDNLVEDYFKNN